MLWKSVYSLILLLGYPIFSSWMINHYGKEEWLKRKGKGLSLSAFSNTAFAPKIWIHAVSAGEVQSAFPVILALKRKNPQTFIFFSTVTYTGKGMADKLLVDIVDAFIPFPIDYSWIVSRFLKIINPDCYISMESEIWPVFLAEAKKAGVTCILANGRFSERSISRARLFPGVWRDMLGFFDMLFLIDDATRNNLLTLGFSTEKIVAAGNTKIDALITRKNLSSLNSVGEKLHLRANSRTLLAGSTREGEEPIVLSAYKSISKNIHDLRLIIVPRHAHRAGDVLEMSQRMGLRTFLSSSLSPNIEWDVLVVDEIGVLFDYYGIADAVFVGGSLVSAGGQNIIEPALWGVPICYGPSMSDFAETDMALRKLGVSKIVTNERELAETWSKALEDDEWIERAKKATKGYFDTKSGASEIIADYAMKAVNKN